MMWYNNKYDILNIHIHVYAHIHSGRLHWEPARAKHSYGKLLWGSGSYSGAWVVTKYSMEWKAVAKKTKTIMISAFFINKLYPKHTN